MPVRTIRISARRLTATACCMSVVVSGRRRVSDVRFETILAEVVVRPAEAAIQYAGQCRLGVAGVRAGVHPSVAADEAQFFFQVAGTFAFPEGNARGQRHQQGGETGGQVVGGIVYPGGCAAEVLEPFGAVAEHGIHGVNHFISQHSWDAEQIEPE